MQQPRTPLVIGHRGAPGYRPEHTGSSYRLALAQGAAAVEPDVVPTRDGVLVVRHENEVSTTTDIASHREFHARKTTKIVDGVHHTGWFTEDFTWGELAEVRAVERLKRLRRSNRVYDGTEPILRLSDVLMLVDERERTTGEQASVVIEVKHADYFSSLGFDWAKMLTNELDRAGWQRKSDRIIYECFELGVLEDLQQQGFGGTFVFLLETRGAPADEMAREHDTGAVAHPFSWYRTDAGMDALIGRIDGVSVAKRDLFNTGVLGTTRETNSLVERAHTRGLLVYTWTLRPENYFLQAGFRVGANPASRGDWEGEFRAIIRTGVDGIFVDHPDLGVSAVRSTLETQ